MAHAPRQKRPALLALLALQAVLVLAGVAFWSAPAQAQSAADNNGVQGPIQLRPAGGDGAHTAAPAPRDATPPPPPLDEFELYARRQTGQSSNNTDNTLRRFGMEVITGPNQFDPTENNAQVPAEYVIAAGDEIQLTLWGSVEADLRLVVDRSGRISVPRVGTISVAGVRYVELQDLIQRRVAQVFRNFQLSVSLGQLRSVRVYVTGFSRRPGAYTVSSLSTIVGALMRSGGPSQAGSFRQIELKRGGQVISRFDFYDLLLKGDKSADRVVQADDIIHIGPVGLQVALIGSVNRPAVFELKPNETLADLVRMAGGFSPVADLTRLALERLEDRQELRITQLPWPQASGETLRNGDLVRAFNVVDTALPISQQNKRVRIEGEVLRPGEYVLPPTSTVNELLELAGGYSANAFVFGAEFSRASERATQQRNYDRALRDLEVDFSRNNTTQVATTEEDAATQSLRDRSISRLIQRLRSIRPTGRIVLEMDPARPELPNMVLEHGDRIYVPPRPTTVGVFGSVYNGGSYLYSDGHTVQEFLRQAGGPTKGADQGSTFIIRANGSVISSPQKAGLFGWRSTLTTLRTEPGDTIFVPEELEKFSWTRVLRDWTQIFYQFGLGAAAIRTLSN